MTSLLGPVTYERAYYHCDGCHHGWHVVDEELHLTTSRTPVAQEMIALTGVQEAFVECAEQLLGAVNWTVCVGIDGGTGDGSRGAAGG